MDKSKATQPLVSIILPTYNRAHVLPHAIKSVLEQSYTHFELIVVDDNSPDNTSEVVKSFNDSRIHYVLNEPNLKLPRALNRGFSLAQGEYLTWTSDDNMYGPDAIEKMVRTLQQEKCDFVYADYYLFLDLDKESKPLGLHHDKLPRTLQLEKGNHIGACFMYTSRLYKLIGDYDPELFLIEDYDYFLRASKHFQFCHIPEPLYYFRRDENTLYSSRYCEVKASDVLVRYKNGVLSKSEAANAIINILIQNPAGLRNPILRIGYHMVNRRSFTLTQWHRKLILVFLKYQLVKPVIEVVEKYGSHAILFKEAKDLLCGLMQKVAKVEYMQT